MTEISGMNAVDYLRNYIQTYLTLTWEENNSLMLWAKYKIKEQELVATVKELKAMGKNRCKICGRVLSLDKFYGSMARCKECYNKLRAKPKKRKKRKVRSKRKRRLYYDKSTRNDD